MLKTIFPFSFLAKTVKGLVISIIGYLVAGAVFGFLFGWLTSLPVIGFIFGIVTGIIGLYFFAGIVIAVLVYLKIVN